MRKNYLILTLIFIGIFLTSASGEKLQSITTFEGENKEVQRNRESDGMLQFTAGGHVLGFRKGEMFITSADHALRIEFVGARSVSPNKDMISQDAGNSRRAAKPLGKVSYSNLWNGVTLAYEKHGSGIVKSTYYIYPVGDGIVNPVDQIRLHYNVPVKVDENGSLLFFFETGQMKESRPVAWQEIKGKRVPVEVWFRALGGQQVGIKVGSYDSRFPLVIDPVLSWNTFMGSTGTDYGYAIAVDTSGNVYVTGMSTATWGMPVIGHAGNNDAFVAKLNSSGVLQWNTFMGSASTDSGRGIAVDTSGNVYVAGLSYATWGTPKNVHAGGGDAFAAKLNSSGVLQWNTFMGSAETDYGDGIAVDTGGNVYVAGRSYAAWGAPINVFAGDVDVFAAKLNSSGTRLWHTFMGSASTDYSYGIAVDTSENVYVTGMSTATWGTPKDAHAGNWDVFAAKLDSNGNPLWNTFMGTAGIDFSNGIAVDTSGNVYVTGMSTATWGTPKDAHAGSLDAFAAKLDSSGNRLWNTFMGSGSDDHGNGIAVDTSGNVYVAGYSDATWGTPVNAHAGNDEAFAAKLNSSGVLQWHTFMGSADDDQGNGIAVDTSGNVYVTGRSSVTWGAPVNAHTGGGNDDAFAAKIGEPEINIKYDATDIPDGGSYDFGLRNVGTDTDVTFTVENTGNADLTLTTPITIGGADAGEFSVQQQPTSPVSSGGTTTFTIRYSPTSAGTKTASLSIDNDDSDEDPYDITLNGEAKVVYTLTIAAGTGGTTNPSPGLHSYDEGTEVSITATANAGYRFNDWTGDVPAGHESDNPVSIPMDSDKSVTANFAREYTLTIAAGTGGTTDPAPGDYIYDEGTQVDVTATPDNGYRFDGWTGDVPAGHENDNPVSITMDSDKSITANFTRECTLTIAATAGGTTNPVPGTHTYDTGTAVNITATENAGYRFSGWSGDVPAGHESDNPVSVTMDSDISVTANFIREYSLTVAAGIGGTTNPSPGISSHNEDTQVDVTAIADNGYRFDGWTGDVPAGHENDNPVSITMDSDKSVTANFIKQYTLTIASGTGGTTDPSPGDYIYDEGTQVDVTAIADNGYRFDGWTGDVPSGHEDDNPVSVTMDSDKSITANFIKQYTLTIAATAGGTTDPVPGDYTYDEGTQVTVTATPEANYRFGSWSGDASGTGSTVTITMDSDKSLTANFIRQYTLTIASTSGGTTNPTPGSYTYDTGTQVSITATADSSYRFSRWTGDVPAGHENDNPVAITMDSDKSVTANFIKQYTLTIATTAGGTTNPAPGTHTYDTGTQVTISCTPDANYRFSHWSGDATGTTEPLAVTMDSDKSITANFIRIIYAPSNFAGRKVVNRSLFLSEYLNALTWQANPANENIAGYRIYQVEGGSRSLLADVNASTFEYWHRRVEGGKQYTYVLVAVNNEGIEGDPASITVQ
jgi:hypothetical protein